MFLVDLEFPSPIVFEVATDPVKVDLENDL